MRLLSMRIRIVVFSSCEICEHVGTRKSGGFLHRKGRKRGKEKRRKREIQNSRNAKFHLLLDHVAVGFKDKS